MNYNSFCRMRILASAIALGIVLNENEEGQAIGVKVTPSPSTSAVTRNFPVSNQDDIQRQYLKAWFGIQQGFMMKNQKKYHEALIDFISSYEILKTLQKEGVMFEPAVLAARFEDCEREINKSFDLKESSLNSNWYPEPINGWFPDSDAKWIIWARYTPVTDLKMEKLSVKQAIAILSKKSDIPIIANPDPSHLNDTTHLLSISINHGSVLRALKVIKSQESHLLIVPGGSGLTVLY